MDPVIRIASSEEHGRIKTMCADWGYDVTLNSSDTVFLAEEADKGVGMVRRTTEEGVLMLRTMLVAPAARDRGIGTQLVQAFVPLLEGQECYCVPYRHLIRFYEHGGFLRVESRHAPVFLQERLADYRSEGLDVVLMRRPTEKRTA
jgi:GNAT superfamily N-acetyltransferase